MRAETSALIRNLFMENHNKTEALKAGFFRLNKSTKKGGLLNLNERQVITPLKFQNRRER